MILKYDEIKEIELIEDFNEQVLAAAVMYARAGFYVIPVRKNGKAIPAKKDGITYHQASKSPETVKKWYTGKYKGWNIGLACGAEDGIFVLDIDNNPEKDKNGFEALEQMEEDHGIFDTLVQVTPSGGKHFVFQWFDNGRSSTSKIAKGVDTRGGSGQCSSHIVAWPSKINGKKYEWCQLGNLEEAPDWLTDLLGVPWGDGNKGNENITDAELERVYSKRDIWAMLKFINPDGLEYEEWLQIGQAIHSQHPDDEGLRMWDKWSQTGERYEPDECSKRWNGFKAYGPIRMGTLVYYAQIGGYTVKPDVKPAENFEEKGDYEQLIDEMNKEYAITVVGGKIRIISQKLNADPEKDVSFLSVDDFKTLNMNKKMAQTLPNGNIKIVPKAQIWLADEKRKEYTGGVHFEPSKQREYETISGLTYNLWRGWTHEPKKGDWSHLKAHITDILCRGNKDLSTWLIDWMADLFQDPSDPKGCAVVMKGIEGCGKGTFMEAMGRTMGRHYKHLVNETHLTGQFNGHMQDALLVFADEIIYGGSRKTAGQLKALVTERKLTVERKGIDAYSYNNCCHLGIASNEEWFIPAGRESRRWFVLDVAGSKANDPDWFKGIYREMEKGGIEAMMYDLLDRKITSNLKYAPETELLQDQRERYDASRHDTMDDWWYDTLELGRIDIPCYLSDDMELKWPKIIKKPELYDNYINWCLNRKLTTTVVSKPVFYKNIYKYGFTEIRPNNKKIIERCGGGRLRMFEAPDYDEAVRKYSMLTKRNIL